MSGMFLSLTNQLLHRSLGAVSGLYDVQLIKSGEDPNKLRNAFYEFYTRRSEVVSIGIQGIEYDSITFQTGASIASVPGWTGHDEITHYITIYQNSSGEFYQVMSDDSVFVCDYESDDDIDVHIPNPTLIQSTRKKANFIEITQLYQLAIIDICEYFGWDVIIEYIQSQ